MTTVDTAGHGPGSAQTGRNAVPKMASPTDQASAGDNLGREFLDAVSGHLPPDVVRTADQVLAADNGSPATTWPRSIGAYAKAIVPALGAAGYALHAALDDNVVTRGEWEGIGFGLLLAVLVAVVPNARKSD